MSRRIVGALLGFAASMVDGEGALPFPMFDSVGRRRDAIDAAQPYRRRQFRNLAHEETVQARNAAKQARKNARRLALRDAAYARRLRAAARQGRVIVVSAEASE